MSNFNKYFKENGFLTSEGENLLNPVEKAIKSVFSQEDVKSFSESQLRILGSALAKLVGDTVSDHQQAKREVKAKFAAMTNDQFEAYLKAKYGDRWMLVSLTEEEFERLPRLSNEEIKAALEEGRKAREEFERNVPMVRIDPSLRFR